MARTQSSVKSLCVLLAKRIFCTETMQTADALHMVPNISRPLQTLSAGKPGDVTVAGQNMHWPHELSDAGLHHARHAVNQTAPCPAFSLQHIAGTPFAPSSFQQTRQQVPIISLVQLLAQRQPHGIAVWQFGVEEDTMPSKPQSIGSIAKYGSEDVNLTTTIILTPTREVDKITRPPSVVIPLRADSVRRKRKHKMNKHKHKKRRKLQRHKN